MTGVLRSMPSDPSSRSAYAARCLQVASLTANAEQANGSRAGYRSQRYLYDHLQVDSAAATEGQYGAAEQAARDPLG